MRLIAVLGQGKCLPTRLTDVRKLNISKDKESAIYQIMQTNYMDWEMWIESADTFKLLKDRLRKHGYKNLPIHGKPELMYVKSQIHSLTIDKLPNQHTMTQRNSRN